MQILPQIQSFLPMHALPVVIKHFGVQLFLHRSPSFLPLCNFLFLGIPIINGSLGEGQRRVIFKDIILVTALLSYNYILQNVKLMRARSGAIHSDSEESFTKLAEMSANQTGIFYDDKTNRRLMNKINAPNNPTPNPNPPHLRTTPTSTHHPKKLFSGFDFNLEFEVLRQEREELERMTGLERREMNVGIVSEAPQQVMDELCRVFALACAKQYSPRGVDLVIGALNSTIYKFWIFDRERMRGDALVELYLARCSLVVEDGEFKGLMERVDCNLMGKVCQVKESLPTNLTC